jgi:hypothetical protein
MVKPNEQGPNSVQTMLDGMALAGIQADRRALWVKLFTHYVMNLSAASEAARLADRALAEYDRRDNVHPKTVFGLDPAPAGEVV